MEDSNVTASAIISFVEQLEDSSSRFYEGLAERFADNRDRFLAFAKESGKNKELVIRTYQETITDALEACYSFEGMRLQDYDVEHTLAGGAGYPEALKMAVELEGKASQFYQDVAERGQALLATIPRAFRKVADRRSKRKLELQALLDRA